MYELDTSKPVTFEDLTSPEGPLVWTSDVQRDMAMLDQRRVLPARK